MKVICTKKFIDKETKELHKVGDIFEVTEERKAAILGVGDFVADAPEDPEEETTEEAEAEAEVKAAKKTTKKKVVSEEAE